MGALYNAIDVNVCVCAMQKPMERKRAHSPNVKAISKNEGKINRNSNTSVVLVVSFVRSFVFFCKRTYKRPKKRPHEDSLSNLNPRVISFWLGRLWPQQIHSTKNFFLFLLSTSVAEGCAPSQRERQKNSYNFIRKFIFDAKGGKKRPSRPSKLISFSLSPCVPFVCMFVASSFQHQQVVRSTITEEEEKKNRKKKISVLLKCRQTTTNMIQKKTESDQAKRSKF